MADRIGIARRERRVQAEQFIPELEGTHLQSRAKKPGFFAAAALNDTMTAGRRRGIPVLCVLESEVRSPCHSEPFDFAQDRLREESRLRKAECGKYLCPLLLRCFGHLKRDAGRVIGSWDCVESDLSIDIPFVLVQALQILNCVADCDRVENISVANLDRLNYSRISS